MKLQSAPNTLQPNTNAWSYQIDGNCMDIIAPNDLLTRVVVKDGQISIQIMPHDNQAAIDAEDFKDTVEGDFANINTFTLSVSDEEPERAYVSFTDCPFFTGVSLHLNCTHEGVITDVWSDDEDESIISVAAMPDDFLE